MQSQRAAYLGLKAAFVHAANFIADKYVTSLAFWLRTANILTVGLLNVVCVYSELQIVRHLPRDHHNISVSANVISN